MQTNNGHIDDPSKTKEKLRKFYADVVNIKDCIREGKNIQNFLYSLPALDITTQSSLYSASLEVTLRYNLPLMQATTLSSFVDLLRVLNESEEKYMIYPASLPNKESLLKQALLLGDKNSVEKILEMGVKRNKTLELMSVKIQKDLMIGITH